MNRAGSGGHKILVLYQVSNAKGDEGQYNAFEMSRVRGGINLDTVKKACTALHHISSAGSDGFQWRVRVDDKPSSTSNGGGSSTQPRYSWWDIQDVNAPLPVKELTLTELNQILSPKKSMPASEDSISKGMRTLGKAMTKVTNSADVPENGPRIPVLIFKLIDLIKIFDDFSGANTGAVATRRTSSQKQSKPRQYQSGPYRPPANNSATQPPRQAHSAHTRRHAPTNQHEVRHSAQTTVPPNSAHHTATNARPTPNPPKVQEGPLMDFGPGPSHQAPPPSRVLHHANSAPPESRAQKLKKEYERNQQTQNRVWDEVDQRWVAVDPKAGPVKNASISAPPGAGTAPQKTTKVKAISIDENAAIGKSAHVAAGVKARVEELKASQKKAVDEIREREEKKKQSEEEEDQVRQRLEPKVKAWCEEHGKKKQLRALLSTLHTILWPDAKWKPVNLGDILDDRKCKICFHKASRVVHPDKTLGLNPEQRFLAKRIFDALSQAKYALDNA